MKIAIGADSYGFELKQQVKNYLLNQGLEVEDVGVSECHAQTPYYQTASEVARRVASQQVNRGILVCGTGMGMAIIANKHPGIYAAVCENAEAARRSRSINNSNILTLGGFVTTPQVAQEIVDTWLTTEFTQGWEPSIQEWLLDTPTEDSALDSNFIVRTCSTRLAPSSVEAPTPSALLWDCPSLDFALSKILIAAFQSLCKTRPHEQT